MQYGYQTPDAPAGSAPVDLTAAANPTATREPAPDQRVLCINRGEKPLLGCMFDGRAIDLPGRSDANPSALFYIEYQAGKHFQRRLIVPGTKNLEGQTYVSWIGILGVDPPEHCEPFTHEELVRFGEKAEAIDRETFTDPADRNVQILKTSSARAASATLGMGGGRGRVGIDTSAQATAEAEAAASDVLSPPVESATREAEAEAVADGVRPARGGRGR